MKPLTDYIPVDPREGSTIRCYRYLGSHWMDSLVNGELKTANFIDFNDIFDGRGYADGSLSDEFVSRNVPVGGLSKDGFAKLKEELNARFRKMIADRDELAEAQIICFSESSDEILESLMWSHYADKWHGVRLGFDFLYDLHREINYKMATTPFVLDCVRYTDEYPKIDLSLLERLEDDTYFTKCYRDFILHKSTAWAYEKEWRMLVQRPDAILGYDDKGKEAYFWKFHPLLLKRVDVGPLVCSDQQNDIVALLRDRYPHVEINKVVLHDRDYGYDYVPIV